MSSKTVHILKENKKPLKVNEPPDALLNEKGVVQESKSMEVSAGRTEGIACKEKREIWGGYCVPEPEEQDGTQDCADGCQKNTSGSKTMTSGGGRILIQGHRGSHPEDFLMPNSFILRHKVVRCIPRWVAVRVTFPP